MIQIKISKVELLKQENVLIVLLKNLINMILELIMLYFLFVVNIIILNMMKIIIYYLKLKGRIMVMVQ